MASIESAWVRGVASMPKDRPVWAWDGWRSVAVLWVEAERAFKTADGGRVVNAHCWHPGPVDGPKPFPPSGRHAPRYDLRTQENTPWPISPT